MKAAILAPGSRGDVQPYIAIGQALQKLGHHATIVTTVDHETLVRGYGLDVATIPVNVAAELQRVETNRSVEGGGVIASFRQFAAIAKRAAVSTAEVGLEASRSADVVVTNFGTTMVASGISNAVGIPVVQAFNVPITPTSAFPGALFPGLNWGSFSRRLSHRLSRAALWFTARTSANEACTKVFGSSRAPLFPGSDAGLLPGQVLYGFSEAFLPRPADWPSHVQVTGFWFVEESESFAPPDDLQRFLNAGDPPVCVGFGSMKTEKPEELSAMVLEAAKLAEVRLVLLSGWAGLKPELLSTNVIASPGLPHSWLYPKCRVVVHHGGAGTTAAAVRAGVPAVVVPFHGDQPFWAQRVWKMGVGPQPIPRKKLTVKRLADALRTVVQNESLHERAAAMGRRVRADQGAMVAAKAIVAAKR